MADDTEQELSDEELEEPRKSSTVMVIVVVMLAIAIGGAVGFTVVAPQLAGAGETGARAEEIAAGGDSEGEGGSGSFYTIDNMVVNPAGSEGLRFVIVSVAFEVSGQDAVEHLRSKEVKVRDMVSSILERQTLKMLTRPGARDSVKLLLRHGVKTLLRANESVRVYIPQFVIQ